jgi:uncharacterized protein (TIGR01777 family)
MKVVIAGGTGFLGSALTRRLAGRGDDVVILTRSGGTTGDARVRHVAWTPDGRSGAWATELDGAGAVVNLAGASLGDRRWTAARKVELRRSRVESTRSLVAAVRAAKQKPAVFVQGSAVGYYGTSATPTFDESCSPGDDVLGEMAVAWEAEAHPLDSLGVRHVFLRSAIVLSRDGGAVPRLITPFKFFVGGPLGSGRQPWSWIHLDDWLALVLWAIDTPTAHGVYNASAPNPVSNAEFAKALGAALHRPSWIPVPAFVLRIIVGEFAPIGLTQGQRVVPKRALAEGFAFKYPEIGAAMRAAVGTSAAGDRPAQ